MEGQPKRKQTTVLIERLNGGRLRIERRNGSPNFTAAAFLGKKRNLAKSTGESNLTAARNFAQDWYVKQLIKLQQGQGLWGRNFSDAVASFLRHADAEEKVTPGQRKNYRQKWSLLQKLDLSSVDPKFDDRRFDSLKLTEIDSDFLLKLRSHRKSFQTKLGKPITNATIKKDLEFVRLVLRHARDFDKCLKELPTFPSFGGRKWTVPDTARPFLSSEDWNTVKRVAKDRAGHSGLNPRTKAQREELLCFIMICVGAALRVDEAYSLRWQDCCLVTLRDPHRTEAVSMKVFGKHSTATGIREDAYALYDGVVGFKRLKALRPNALDSEPLFLERHRDGMRELLEAADLRYAEGISRDSKSLRQTGISLRLDLGPNIDYRDIAKWARTSPGQIGKFYDQTHPQTSVERLTGFRTPRDAFEREQMKNSAAALAALRKLILKEQERAASLPEYDQGEYVGD